MLDTAGAAIHTRIMRQRTALITLLIVASALVDCATLVFAENHPDSPLANSLPASLAISQVVLISIWAGIGRIWVFARLTVLLGVCWLWSRLLGPSKSERVLDASETELGLAWLTILAFAAWPTLLLTIMWRDAGLGLVDSSTSTKPVPVRRTSQKQFRIVDILGATLVLAVFLAMMRHSFQLGSDWLFRVGIVAVIAFPMWKIATATSFFTTWLVWVTLRRRDSSGRATTLVTAGSVVGLYWLSKASPGAESLHGSSVMFTSATTLLLTGSLLVFRLAGYRVSIDVDRFWSAMRFRGDAVAPRKRAG